MCYYYKLNLFKYVMICPNCEKEIENNITQCPYCGCHFSVRIVPKSVQISAPIIEEYSKRKNKKKIQSEIQETTTVQECPRCSKQIAVDARFCKWCGSTLSQTQEKSPIVFGNQPALTENMEKDIPVVNVCKNCGRTIKATALFCKWCGCPCNNKKQDEK